MSVYKEKLIKINQFCKEKFYMQIREQNLILLFIFFSRRK